MLINILYIIKTKMTTDIVIQKQLYEDVKKYDKVKYNTNNI